jgi:hypothetical protein
VDRCYQNCVVLRWLRPSPAATGLLACVSMSAQPVHEPDSGDPVEILRVLPTRFHEQFLAEY